MYRKIMLSAVTAGVVLGFSGCSMSTLGLGESEVQPAVLDMKTMEQSKDNSQIEAINGKLDTILEKIDTVKSDEPKSIESDIDSSQSNSLDRANDIIVETNTVLDSTVTKLNQSGLKSDIKKSSKVAEISLESVFQFRNNSAKVVDSNKLQALADIVKNSDMKMVLVGHADASGVKSYNQKLSEKRVQAVYDALPKSKNIGLMAMGETMPKYDNNGANRGKNRRVEVYIGNSFKDIKKYIETIKPVKSFDSKQNRIIKYTSKPIKHGNWITIRDTNTDVEVANWL